MKQKLYWATHIATNSPLLAKHALSVALESRRTQPHKRQQILVATHHKVLTVFLARVFRTFATITGRSWDVKPGNNLDYARDVLVAHQSLLRWEFLPPGFAGIHVIRDPRDVLVSSMHYHRKSNERWLQWPVERLGWRTYQEALNALPNDEDRLIFEIEGETGVTIRNMLNWDYNRPGVAECRYDDLIGEHALGNFTKVIAGWDLTDNERVLLRDLFDYFSLGGPGQKKTHIRNPSTGQWRKHFTPRVQDAFDRAFPGAAAQLGFEE
ncbi:sulfotransferase domain-containing protein [Porphyrobacter sp. YT40]|uniref:sulfotransferase domain-containing protein n=1 Tax=Porphyrobacter sp. YT40 TaxID=2547601 RepID=UPI001142939A|nr:sulfotransferase domain-containing protein [Porphyrobacter sp. YT40]QDH33864.1 sulfotransferase domain-containing protein [Porphyrobacter sp. YT40]